MLRDVFTGRLSLSHEDEDKGEWLDGDEEPGHIGGVGQTPATTASFSAPAVVWSPVDPAFGDFPLGESTIVFSTPHAQLRPHTAGRMRWRSFVQLYETYWTSISYSKWR